MIICTLGSLEYRCWAVTSLSHIVQYGMSDYRVLILRTQAMSSQCTCTDVNCPLLRQNNVSTALQTSVILANVKYVHELTSKHDFKIRDT